MEYQVFKKKNSYPKNKFTSIFKAESIELEKEGLIDDIFTKRDDIISSIGRTKMIEKSKLYEKLPTRHQDYCFMNPTFSCCKYNTTELCVQCHLTKKEKEKVKSDVFRKKKKRVFDKTDEIDKGCDCVHTNSFSFKERENILQ